MPTHYAGSKQERRALDAYIKLMRATDSLNRRLLEPIERRGLTLPQFAVLEALLHLGPTCLTELAHKLLVSGGNITLVARNLERSGWVRRRRGKEDKRFASLHLTAKGEKLIRKAFSEHARSLTREMSALSAGEQEELARLTKKLGRAVARVERS